MGVGTPFATLGEEIVDEFRAAQTCVRIEEAQQSCHDSDLWVRLLMQKGHEATNCGIPEQLPPRGNS